MAAKEELEMMPAMLFAGMAAARPAYEASARRRFTSSQWSRLTM